MESSVLKYDLIGQRQQRLEKVAKLREMGIDPYPAKANRDLEVAEVKNNYQRIKGKIVTLAGRLTAIRKHGKLVFINIFDQTGSIQILLRDDWLLPTSKETQTLGFADLSLLDLGDIVEIHGEVNKSKTGEISVFAKTVRILTKAIRPLPNTLADKEQQFRRRYLDLLINPEKKERFLRKSKFFEANRNFLVKHGFTEVETPVLEHITGGADARPFETYHNDLDQNFYLRISTELYQKRLIGGGFEKIFTIGPNFRNEGLSDEHLQEFYQVEWYWAYATYKENMELVKEMFRYIAKNVYGKTKFSTRGHEFDLAKDWQLIDYPVIIKEKFAIDVFKDSDDKIREVIKKQNLELTGVLNRNRMIDNLWKLIRKNISGPAFLINVPKFISPLAKSKPEEPELTERFQVIISGSELGNGYSELNDPQDQLKRFVEQQKLREAGDEEAQMMDIDYVEMLEYGMPPTSGYGHSERLFWFLEDVSSREGTLFPQLKFELENNTKKIYQEISDYIDPTVKVPGKEIDKKAKLTIDKSVKAKWPSIAVGYAEIHGVKITKKHPELEELKVKTLTEFKDLDLESLNKMPEILSYRKMYKDMGVDWHSRRPSPEALLRRIIQGKGLYTVNTCVDAYNLIVIRNHVSIGAFDLDKVAFPTDLNIAQGGEKIRLLLDKKDTELERGEVAYFDRKGPYNLDFNYRDADRTKVTEETVNLVINIDGVYEISSEQIEKTLQETVEIIIRFCGGKVRRVKVIT
ncbi:MAG TPA: lysine--tRNA ligase [Candidatus Dojkabacteria bacterium]|nr:lysine--tRNA ligase [Candidatus Dojkabacteria bacterium]